MLAQAFRYNGLLIAALDKDARSSLRCEAGIWVSNAGWKARL